MIFILDDDNSRIKKIMKKFGKDNVVYANDPVEAETALRENDKFDIIFLDHDLGGPYTRGPKGDGIDLSRVMAKDNLHTDSFITNGSMIGYNEYAYNKNFSFERPQQAMFIVHPDKGLIFRTPIFCDSYEDTPEWENKEDTIKIW